MIYVPDSVGEVLYSPLGHYTVGDSWFYSNRDALEASYRTGQPVAWHYYDDVWASAHAAGHWRDQSLKELYYARARQLREQYDYVAVMFSGGWDSRNIIESFAAQGLRIDDIIVFVTPELENTTEFNNFDPDNWYGEIMYHAVPYAERYAAEHPGTGVIKIEWLDHVADAFNDAEQVFNDSRPKPGVFFGRWLSVARNAELDRRIGSRRAALLVGLDKPCVIQNATTARAFFPEGLLRLYSYCTKGNGFPDNVTWEPFYWTPDLPELAIRGWYELLDLCRKDPAVNIAHSLDQSLETRNTAKMSRYVQDAMRQRLYPGFDPRAWQANKQSDFGFFMEFELPILRVLEQRNRHLRSVLGEVLNETAARINESDLQIGDRTRNGLTPWIDKSIHDGHTVLDYRSFLSPMIDLDISFGRP
jgi:hypothetical protein